MMKNFFIWSDNFLVHVPEIDNEHHKIIDALKLLANQFDSGVSPTNLVSALEEASALVAKHFRNEESLLEKFNYPGLQKQKLEHSSFIKKMESTLAAIKADKQPLTERVLREIDDWLTNHLLGADMAYGEFLRYKV